MGLIAIIKKILRSIFFPSVYIGGFIVAFYSIFKDAIFGLYILIFLNPQPNIWHKFFDLPMGKDFLDLLFIAILLGIFVQGKKLASSPNTFIIVVFLFITYLSLWNSSLTFDLPLPISPSNSQLFQWKNFAQMIFFYFFITIIVKDEEQQKKVFMLMAVVVLLMAIRNFRNFTASSSFSYDKRVGGPFELVGLGATHYGAFVAHFMVAFLGMSFFEKNKKKKILYLTTFLFCLHPLFFSYSRGAYLGVFTALLFYGIIKKRQILFILLVVIIGWHIILPSSVVDRIAGTETENGKLESSANTRLLLWDQAEAIIAKNFIFGVGWEGFGLTVERTGNEIYGLMDTHNYYLKSFCDRGIIGLVLLLALFVRAFLSGLRLFRCGESDFQRGLGFCFMGTVIVCMVTNVFGDRFTYYVLGSYYWILWGLVDKGLMLTSQKSSEMKKVDHLRFPA